uniref:Uncharacterized protein n=1 Tax=Timema bartmani TaxID=61472 RepID=A0A7R9I0G0_9NEOP|nr:unnamed protein product [Timema bartmani]
MFPASYRQDESRWELLQPTGERPPCLQEHSAVAYRDNIYVFGGEVGFSAGTETPLWVYHVKGQRRLHLEGVYLHLCGGRLENHLGKYIFNTPNRDTIPDLPIIGSAVNCKRDALDKESETFLISRPYGFRNKLVD